MSKEDIVAEKPINPDALRQRIENRYKQRGEFMVHLVVFVLVNLLLFGLWGTISAALGFAWLLAFPWPVVVLLGWGSGLAGHGLSVYYEAGPPARQLEQRVADEMRDQYGYDWPETATQQDYRRLRKSLEKPFNERKEIAIHAAVFVLINIMLWWMWALLPNYMPDTWTVLQFPWPVVVTLGWGIGLVAHATNVYFNSGFSESARERAIQDEMAQVYGESEKRKRDNAAPAKRKRDRLMLTDDGELMEIVGDEDDDSDLYRAR